jgi:hypothetical protein
MQMHINVAQRTRLTRVNRGLRFLVACWIVLSLALMVLSATQQQPAAPAHVTQTHSA